MSVAYLMTFIVGAITLRRDAGCRLHSRPSSHGRRIGVPTALFGYYKLERAAIISSIAGVVVAGFDRLI